MMMGRPNVIVLKEGTDTSQGKPQLISNINACQAIVNIIRTTLGPRGMDKLIGGKETTISNDGATLMKKLEVEHPAAKTLVDISMSQDSEVGDGTTSVVILAGEFLSTAKRFIEDGVHPQVIIRSYRQALQLALAELKRLSVEPDRADLRATLEKCAVTALNSKLVAYHGDFFAKMAVDAVFTLDDDLDINLIGIKKVPGGTMLDSFLVQGVAFKKTFSYAGFEQQPKSMDNCTLLLLNIELELKAEKDNAEIRMKDPSQYQSIVDAEWDIIYKRLAQCAACAPEGGSLVVLSKLAIGDLATQYFADRGIFCAGRIPGDDMRRIAAAVGGMVMTTVSAVPPAALGHCQHFEERQVGGERYNLFTGCPGTKTVTIVLRGGAEQFIEETDRSIHDAIMIVRRALKNTSVVGGGGAIEMLLSKYLRDCARKETGKGHLIINGFAQALEVIPRQLAENAGFESADIMNNLRYKHNTAAEGAGGPVWFGVDVDNDGICDTLAKPVWEPLIVKKNALTAATEAACLILSVDETIKNENRQQVQDNTPVGGRAPIGGAGMAGMMRGRGRTYRGMRGK